MFSNSLKKLMTSATVCGIMLAGLSATKAKAGHWEITFSYSGLVKGQALRNSALPAQFVKAFSKVNGYIVSNTDAPFGIGSLSLATIPAQQSIANNATGKLSIENYASTIGYGSPEAWSATRERNPTTQTNDPQVFITVAYAWVKDFPTDTSTPPAGTGSWTRRITISDNLSPNIYSYGGGVGSSTSDCKSKFGLFLPCDTVPSSPNVYRHTFIGWPNTLNSVPCLNNEPHYAQTSIASPSSGGNPLAQSFPVSEPLRVFTPGLNGSFTFLCSWDLFVDGITTGSGLGSGSGTTTDMTAEFAVDLVLP